MYRAVSLPVEYDTVFCHDSSTRKSSYGLAATITELTFIGAVVFGVLIAFKTSNLFS